MGRTQTRIVNTSGNGSAYPDVQSAIDALGSEGGAVYVERGTYSITSAIAVPSNVSVIGRGNVVIHLDDHSDICGIKNRDHARGNRNISLIGLQIKSGRTGQQTHDLIDLRRAKDCLLRDLKIDGVARNGQDRAGIAVRERTSERNRISNCSIFRCDWGITLRRTDDSAGPTENLVEGCMINDCHVGVYLWKTDQNVVRGNTIHGFREGAPVVGHSGILAQSSSHNVIQGNRCYHSCEHGIYISGNNGDHKSSWDNAVTGNTCSENQRIGIHLCGESHSPVRDTTVVGNTCHSNGDDGIALDNYTRRNTVTGNCCYSNGRYGIWELGTGSKENIILGNCCLGNHSAECDIRTRQGSGTIVEHNQGRMPP